MSLKFYITPNLQLAKIHSLNSNLALRSRIMMMITIIVKMMMMMMMMMMMAMIKMMMMMVY